MLPENTGSYQAFVTPTQQVLEAFANRLPFLWTVLRHLHSQQLHLIPIFIFLPWTALYLLQGKLICLRRWLSYQLWVIKNMFLQTLCLVQILFDCTRVQTWQIWPIPCRDQVMVQVYFDPTFTKWKVPLSTLMKLKLWGLAISSWITFYLTIKTYPVALFSFNTRPPGNHWPGSLSK